MFVAGCCCFFFLRLLLTGLDGGAAAAGPELLVSVGPQSPDLEENTSADGASYDDRFYADQATERSPDEEQRSTETYPTKRPGVPLKHHDPDGDDFVRRPQDSLGSEDSDSLTHENAPEFLREYYESFKEPPGTGTNCSYGAIFAELMLNQNESFTLTRPVNDHRAATLVYLELAMSAILDVSETQQIFVAHIWLYKSWHNKFIRWSPKRHCGIKHVIVPSGLLWKPDVIIEEMIEKDKTPPSPFLKIRADGEVEHRSDVVVTGSCQMDVYQFPFDTQRCNITLKSLMHTDAELRFVVNLNSTVVMKWTRKVMQTQYEWLFTRMTVSTRTTAYFFDANQTAIVYTIHMRRRSVLYAANFLLPVFFFLCMDVASFFIPNGEKISFKVTVLLAVTVMQLILNEILPCSSDRMPLIVVYCLGVFLLLLVSLMETILACYLMEKDCETRDKGDRETDAKRTPNGDKRAGVSFNGFPADLRCASGDNSADEAPSETKQGNTLAVEVDDDSSAPLRKEEEEEEEEEGEGVVTPGHWTRLAGKITRGFFALYLSTAVVFFAYLVALWTSSEEDQF